MQVKFLIQNSADVRARAYGAFFQEGSVVYYGEFPLSFAACTGQKDIVSYLKRHGAHVNTDRDTRYGHGLIFAYRTWLVRGFHACISSMSILMLIRFMSMDPPASSE
jgi:hypothetical protein